MPSALPLGDPAPLDGSLPASVLDGASARTLSLYIHVPFCAKRCGYCDFNTYTASELGGGGSQADYPEQTARELEFARSVLNRAVLPERDVDTVFFGGGTPTLLPAAQLASILTVAKTLWPFAPGAEVTTEANPDSVTADGLQTLADAGFTRVSFGMQSAVPHVLRVLDRTHDPANVARAVGWARDAGLSVSLDLIYGTPGESANDWQRSLDAALECEPDHISAYALIIEEGTKLAAQIRRREVPDVDDDDHATKYEMADTALTQAGMQWYEVSNWARTAQKQCHHNMAYWRSGDWWGIGPGAHSHIGGVRWWNAKHPSAWAGRLVGGESPAVGRESLDQATRDIENVMLRTRLAEGLAVNALSPAGRTQVAGLIADELIEPSEAFRGRIRLTLRGRLLADAVVRRLLPD